MTRLLVCGDLHLDKGGRYGRAPGERLAEQEIVWGRCLELAREHEADAVLFAGDAFEKRHPSTDALLAFERPLVEYGGQPVPVIAIPGNHDRSGVSDYCALDVFAEADLLTLHSRPGVTSVSGVSIACLPWAPVSRIVSAEGGGDRDDVNAAAAELLLETARGLRSQVEGPCVLLTHFSISGAVTPDGADVGLFREPVLDLGDLEAIGFDAVIAGHIHRPALLNPETPYRGNPIVYVGSPMPLDFGESKCEHGVWLLDVLDEGSTATFLPIESRPFVTIDLDLTTHEGIFNLSDPGYSLADAFVKVRYRASPEQALKIDADQMRRSLLNDYAAHNVWIEPSIVREVRARVQGLDEAVSDVDALELWIESQNVNVGQAPALRERHTGYLAEVAR